ncbi:uncharacterized protein LOC129758130 [Uranotaenia lowii]|uniref:uncharacterized protein LOC129758130 n=1 Tax=Uranotaenia lowii TaxID=190385 RepID=UPI0024789B51|nr:uncharacterized protein LOC129758130 [Uranotaenia lowii]
MRSVYHRLIDCITVRFACYREDNSYFVWGTCLHRNCILQVVVDMARGVHILPMFPAFCVVGSDMFRVPAGIKVRVKLILFALVPQPLHLHKLLNQPGQPAVPADPTDQKLERRRGIRHDKRKSEKYSVDFFLI